MVANQFQIITDALPEALILISDQLEIVSVNKAALEVFGCVVDKLVGRQLTDITTNSEQNLLQQMKMWLRSRKPLPATLHWNNTLTQMDKWSCHGFLLKPKQVDETGYVIIRCILGKKPSKDFMDLNREFHKQTEMLRKLQKSRDELAAEHERAMVTLESIGDAVITTDENGIIEYLNPVAEQLTGWSSQESNGKKLLEVFNIINEITRQPAIDPISRCLEENRIVGLANHTALINRDGMEYIIEDSAAPIRNRRDNVIGAVMVFRDVTEERLTQRQLRYLAQHDTLTTLNNRHHFEQELEKAVQIARRGHIGYALLYLDLDQFKVINDTAGHGVGDELLREVAQLFTKRVRKSDVLARLGGDEFGVLLSDADIDIATEVAESLISEMGEYTFEGQGVRYDISTSIGITLIDEDTTSAAEVLRLADIACYIAKRAGRNRYHVYSGDDTQEISAVGELNLATDIKHALLENRFVLYFQSIESIQQDESTKHFEVLLRLKGENGKMISPAMIIPTAERFNLMTQIDIWVVTEAISVLAGLQQAGHDIAFSVNLSGTSLGDQALQDSIKSNMAKYKLAEGSLVFEVTETAAVSVATLEQTTEFMEHLRSKGCKFSLDDFGTGFSSFAYLKYLPVDYVKIDGTFVRDILKDPVDQAMVRSINQISHSLGKKTVAEFVESKEILEQIKRIGIDYAQGYYLGKPGTKLKLD
ncbi:MAG: EAL domain-containing protein [Thioalkalispiraceae bacterium]|jgi:diguanylate cyclase (GGDEF)-like protein/PAS domain S-box-containing protein